MTAPTRELAISLARHQVIRPLALGGHLTADLLRDVIEARTDGKLDKPSLDQLVGWTVEAAGVME